MDYCYCIKNLEGPVPIMKNGNQCFFNIGNKYRYNNIHRNLDVTVFNDDESYIIIDHHLFEKFFTDESEYRNKQISKII